MDNDKLTERPISLKETSWALLDEACRIDDNWTPSRLIDSLLQTKLRDDGGEMVKRLQTLSELRKLFGHNEG